MPGFRHAVVAVLAAAAIFAPIAATQVQGAERGGDAERHAFAGGLARDADRDGLRARFERRRLRTNPRKRDTDGDGLMDGYEWRRSKTSPRRKDTDRDGGSDSIELLVGTDPRKSQGGGQSPAPPLAPPPPPPPQPCGINAASASEARNALRVAVPGQVVCLAAGSHGELDLRNIDHPDYVTLRGAPGLATTVDGILVGGSSYLRIEGFRSTGCICFREQWTTHHLQFLRNEVGPTDDYGAIAGAGAWTTGGPNGPVHDFLFERNYIHDATGYGVTIGGDGQRVTVRYNRFERIREDYLQSGEPTGWTVDRNWFGPGDFNRPAGYPGHPDVWQTLESGSNMTFTNNLVRDTNESLGFIWGDIGGAKQGFRNVLVSNNLFLRPVYGVGETCQFSGGIDFVFEHNTLVDARGCRWGSGENADWPDASNVTIRKNVLAGSSRLTCNDTSLTSVCPAFNAGRSDNTQSYAGGYADQTFWVPTGAGDRGHRLSQADFQGFPFNEGTPVSPQTPSQVRTGGLPPGIGSRKLRAYIRTMVSRRTKGKTRRLGRSCSGKGSPIVTCFLTWRIGRRAYRGDVLFRHALEGGGLRWDYSFKGTRKKARCRACRSKSLRW
jgi:hypothetical protein